jgi:hypothetical protein
MDIYQESVPTFSVGHGQVDALAKELVAAGYDCLALKGVRVRAATANTGLVYVGSENVTADMGYPLPAGEEVSIPINHPSKVYVIGGPSGNSTQTVTLANLATSDTFALAYKGQTTTPLAQNAAGSDVQAALAALSTVGAGNVSVSGDAGGPYTVEFVGTLAGLDAAFLVGSCAGSATGTVAIASVAQASDGCKYSWLSA